LQIEANYLKAAQFIQRAASLGAQLAVLPEYQLTNWVPEDPKFTSLCDQWKVYLDKYRSLAKECNICIVPGTIVERHEDAEKDEDKLINVAYFIDNKGEVLGSYQKKNLWYAIPLFPSQLDGRVSTPLLTQATSKAQASRTSTPNFLNP